MNAAMERKLDAQAQQMAFEMGFAPDPATVAERDRRRADRQAREAALANLRPVTEKQVSYIKRLLEERDVAPSVMEQVAIARGQIMQGALSSQGASALIDELLVQPRKVAGQPTGWTRTALPTRELEDGIYVDKDDEGQDHIFKVYVAVHGSGQLCVKRLVVTTDGGRFEYMGLAAKHLPRSARKMTLDEAKAFGAIYGFCVRCGRTLTDEESISAGIGPICAEKM